MPSGFGPTKIGGAMTSAPTAISLGPNSINAVAPGVDANIRNAEFNGTQWTTTFLGILGGHIGLPSRYRFSVDFVTVDVAPRSLSVGR